MKSTAFLTILMTGFCFSTLTCVAQTANGQQKKEQNVKVAVGEELIKVRKNMTVLADSIYHQFGPDVNVKKVTVTVFEPADGTGNGSTYTYSIGDSLQNKEAHAIVRSAGGKNMIITQNGESEIFDLPTSPATAKRFRINGDAVRDPFAFNPSDTTIVSYKKKDMGKGLEKITIVRKKAVNTK